jgi:hypothetical protein
MAQTVSFTKIELKHNQEVNGRKMLQFWYNLDASGIKGHKLTVSFFVEIPKGNTHKYTNGNTMICESNEINCNSDHSVFNNQWLGIYNDALNPLPGKRTYYVRLWVKDLTIDKWIGHSDYLTYDMEGKDMIPQSYNGRETRICPDCNNSGICKFCNGTKIDHLSHGKCMCVNQTKYPGKCTQCSGLKFQVKYGGMWLRPTDARVSSPKSGIKKACTNCNRTGLEPDLWCNQCLYNPMEFGWHEQYCSACGRNHCVKKDKHDICRMCGGTGYVDD